MLNSAPGRRWLSDKKYREETHETFKEKETLDVSEKSAVEGAEKLGKLEEILSDLRLVDIPAGEFEMGGDEYENEKPVHKVKLSGFKMSATPVTQSQYEAVMGVNPSSFKEKSKEGKGDLPVENVSWNDAMVFCEQLTKMAKGTYRVTLPTEAQWEYACRAGTTTPFNTGENLTTEQANYDGNYPYKNFPKGKRIGKTTPVGSYPPNAWGLYDMHGNVWEWCLDWYDENYYAECNKQGVVNDPTGPKTGSLRVLRGGGWGDDAIYCRSAFRDSNDLGNRFNSVGFRLVFVPQSVGSR